MSAVDGKSNYQRTILDNGVRIVTETMPHVRSLATGFWFITGSRDESDDLAGIAHYLEHMNFKGTSRRSAGVIAREIEGRGGHLNAFTSKELTCYYARVVDEQLPRAVDVLADITHHSLYNPDEVEKERKVIIEELKSVEDSPDELIFEHFISHVFDGHPMGRSVLGTRESLSNINHDRLLNYSSERYNGPRVVIAAAGRLNHNRLARMIERRIKRKSSVQQIRTSPEEPEMGYHRLNSHTNTQQAHIIWGCRGLTYNDPRKYDLLVLNTLLGGGMSSRLFQRIRERHGLAYSVYSFLETYLDTGIFGVYAGTEPQQAEKTLALIVKELRELVRRPVSTRELQRTKDQLKGYLMLGLESPNSRMHRLARMEIYYNDWLPIDDVIASIDAVTSDDILAVAGSLFEQQATYTNILFPN